MKDRIYICHTYYHVYVTFLKELKLRAEADPAKKAGAATLVLSKMSNNFEKQISRENSNGLYDEVLELDEMRDDFFTEGHRKLSGESEEPDPLYEGVRQTRGFLCAGRSSDLQGHLCLLRFRSHRLLPESEPYPLSCRGRRPELSQEF